MNVPAASQKRLVIVGATGMVGGYALRYAIENATVRNRLVRAGRRVGEIRQSCKECLKSLFAFIWWALADDLITVELDLNH